VGVTARTSRALLLSGGVPLTRGRVSQSDGLPVLPSPVLPPARPLLEFSGFRVGVSGFGQLYVRILGRLTGRIGGHFLEMSSIRTRGRDEE